MEFLIIDLLILILTALSKIINIIFNLFFIINISSLCVVIVNNNDVHSLSNEDSSYLFKEVKRMIIIGKHLK
jgi:hypothetical protein